MFYDIGFKTLAVERYFAPHGRAPAGRHPVAPRRIAVDPKPTPCHPHGSEPFKMEGLSQFARGLKSILEKSDRRAERGEALSVRAQARWPRGLPENFPGLRESSGFRKQQHRNRDLWRKGAQ